jgi:multidrug efflux pump subunit AcrB
MNLGRLSINQPILAMVLSIVLLIVGAIAYTTLPVAEYPQVAPPTVVVTTQYPGASAQQWRRHPQEQPGSADGCVHAVARR